MGSVSQGRGSVRRYVIIESAPRKVWDYIGEPDRLVEWFDGIVESSTSDNQRTIKTRAGFSIPEEIVTCDRTQYRFQYKIVAPFVRDHLSTIDVFELGDERSLVSYSCDCDPATMALIIAGAGESALRNLKALIENEG